MLVFIYSLGFGSIPTFAVLHRKDGEKSQYHPKMGVMFACPVISIHPEAVKTFH